jgi:hypothetical protein
MNRRSFCKFLPAAPVVLMAEGARAASEYAPTDDSMSVKIHHAKKKELPRGPNTAILGIRTVDVTKSATLSVGSDGNLWLKNSSDDTWRKVMVE